MNLQRAIISIIAVLVLVAPAALFCAQRIAYIDLPEWLTTEEATYLSGGVTEVNLSTEVTLEGFKTGALQSALEAEIGNYIPAKASLLLGNAALQRSAIAVSDGLFGWGCYPTFYGSSILYIPEYDFLTGLPIRDTEEARARLVEFSVGLARYAIEHSDKTFYVIIPGSAQLSTPLPPAELIRNPLDFETVEEVLSSEWEDIPNLSSSFTAYDDPVNFINDFYHTDGHWNGYGALRAYENLAVELTQLDTVTTKELIDGPVFNGQSARQGLMVMNYPTVEPKLDTSSISVESGASGWLLSEDYRLMFKDFPLEAEFNFYASWYGRDGDAVILNDVRDDNVLLISDSFGDAFRWLLAQSFHRVSNYMDLRAGSQGGVTLQERISQSGADTIIFVAQPSDYLSFLERCPNYFSSCL